MIRCTPLRPCLAVIALSMTLASAGGNASSDSDGAPERQFDFWVGEWSVQNRDLRPDGSWADIDRTRARITPVAGGMALLEEWVGPLRGSFMNGFSLRSWNPRLEQWEIVLFWTVDGNASFGKMVGDFRHGRGEFVSNAAGANRTRYTFADALPSSVRWDAARTSDGGVNWSTYWIMEFSRTRAASEVTEEVLFTEGWNVGTLSPYLQARQLDWLLGTWTGTQVDAEGNEREARLRSRLLNQDCLVVDLLETRASSQEPWVGRLAVRGLCMPGMRWETWSVSSSDSMLRRAAGQLSDDAATFDHARPEGDGTEREILVRVDPDVLVIEEGLIDASGEMGTVLRTTELARQ